MYSSRQIIRAAQRYAAVAMTDAYEMLGYTRSAAVVETAARFGVSSRTLWTWRQWASGRHLGDCQGRLRSLMPMSRGGGQ